MGTPADPSKRSAKSKPPKPKAAASIPEGAAPKVATPRVATPKVAKATASRSKAPQAKLPPPPKTRHELIAVAAYYLAEARGFEPGHEAEDWFAAEHSIGSTAGD